MLDFEQKYLNEFAYLKGKTYLDWSSVGLPPQRTIDAMGSFMQEYADSLGRLCFGPYGKMRRGVQETIAAMIGGKTEDIVLTHNTTDGDCLLMHAYPLSAGDSVIVSQYDYPAVNLGWYQKQKDGIIVKSVPEVNGCVRAEDMIAAMDDTTKIVEVSWVQFSSGYKIDLEMLGNACHERGILLVVDAIQGLGRNVIDVKKCHISLLACGGFKGLLGPLGSAFYYVDPDLVPMLTPDVWAGDNLVVNEGEIPLMDLSRGLPYKEGTLRLSAGSPNNIGLAGLGKSLALLSEIGIDRIQAHVLDLEAYFYKQLKKYSLSVNYLGTGPDDPDFVRHHSGTICITFDPAYLQKLSAELEKAEIYAAVRKTYQGEGVLRFSTHYCNTESDIDRLIHVLKNVIG